MTVLRGTALKQEYGCTELWVLPGSGSHILEISLCIYDKIAHETRLAV